MASYRIKGNSRFSSTILKLDTAYVESICMSYFGDNLLNNKAEKIHSSYYPKPEFTCPLCHAGSKKKQNRPATLIPTEVGYLFKCLACMQDTGAITLYHLLQHMNPDIAKGYQWDRWVKKTAGQGFNVPNPPKRALREYYSRLEEELKQRNKIAYQQLHQIKNRN
jgi:hypothetical protein